jgi:hypothetical protein
MQTAAGDDQRNRESAQQGQQNTHGATMNQSAVPEALGAGHRAGVELIDCGQHRRGQNRSYIQQHP